MGWGFSDEFIFDLRPLLQGRMTKINSKRPKSHLLLLVEVWYVQTTYRKPWATDLLMWLNLTFATSFKVE